jgi:hypothetical protein
MHIPSIGWTETIVLALVAGLALLAIGLALAILLSMLRGRRVRANPQIRPGTTTAQSSNSGKWFLLFGLALTILLLVSVVVIVGSILSVPPRRNGHTAPQETTSVVQVVTMPVLIGTSSAMTPTSRPQSTAALTDSPQPTLTPTFTAQPASRPSATPVSGLQSTVEPTGSPQPTLTATITAQPAFQPSATPDEPRILSFTASPDPVEREGTVTLTWSMSSMTGASITRLSPTGDIFLETEALDLPASGSIALKVPDEYTEAVKYYLGARDANGVLYRAYVTVGIICRYDEYMAPRCPLTQDTIWAAYEPFERGHMVWRSDTQQIYVLHADGSYETYEDTWHEGDPVEIPGSPPSGFYAPLRGFGNLYASQPGLRERLGWATAPEEGYTMRLETIRGGSGRYPGTSVYFTLPSNDKVNLYPFTSTWKIIP